MHIGFFHDAGFLSFFSTPVFRRLSKIKLRTPSRRRFPT
jgi:hypothetical protein